MDPLAHLRAALDDLEAAGLRRRKPAPHAGLSYCSNDYLGLSERRLGETSARVGSGASRLIAGEDEAHAELEGAIASWLGVETSLLFSSGYAANVGMVSALAGPSDLVVSDALNHASLIDGARLSRARIAVTPHNDLEAVRAALASRTEQRAWVVVESYYSMDADGPDLAALRAVCNDHGAALVVDEAHALGVLGPAGLGRCAEAEVRPDVLVGTLGKSFGAQGAFVAGSHLLRDWLWNRARSFVFSTGLAPVVAEAALEALVVMEMRPELRTSTLARAAELRAGLAGMVRGTELRVLGFGHVVPLLVGDSTQALELARLVKAEGLDVPAIRPPTVPTGAARLRFTVTARHAPEDIAHAVRCVERALGRWRLR